MGEIEYFCIDFSYPGTRPDNDFNAEMKYFEIYPMCPKTRLDNDFQIEPRVKYLWMHSVFVRKPNPILTIISRDLYTFGCIIFRKIK